MFQYPCRLMYVNYVILQEEEILDLLEQCEANETITFDRSGNRPICKGPKVTKLFYISDVGMKKNYRDRVREGRHQAWLFES